MPRRKRLPQPEPQTPNHVGLGRSEKNPQNWLVQKSTPLQKLSQTSMTLTEFKILDAYLARIDSHNSEERYVRFEKGELEALLGGGKINRDDLNKRLRNLFQTIEIYDESKPNGFTLIALFTKAECIQDENGLWQIDLVCSNEAMEYIFNIESMGYMRYRLKNVVNLTSRYSYVLFIYLEDNRFRKEWDVSLDELKKLLKCTAETYKEFYRFNDLILKKCYKELNAKTDIKFEYTPVKKGRKVVAIHFVLKTKSDELQLAPDNAGESGKVEETVGQVKEYQYANDNLRLLAEACDCEFSNEEMENIFEIISTKTMPENSDGVWIARYHYLSQKYSMMNVYAQKKPIKDRYLYFVRMLQNDTE